MFILVFVFVGCCGCDSKAASKAGSLGSCRAASWPPVNLLLATTWIFCVFYLYLSVLSHLFVCFCKHICLFCQKYLILFYKYIWIWSCQLASCQPPATNCLRLYLSNIFAWFFSQIYLSVFSSIFDKHIFLFCVCFWQIYIFDFGAASLCSYCSLQKSSNE